MTTTDIATAANLADMVRAQGAALGYSTVFEFEGRRTSFAGLDIHTNRVAHGLAALGVKPHERVVLYNTGTGMKYTHLLPQ